MSVNVLLLASFGGRAAEAALYSLLGMGIIFFVLAILWGLLSVLNRVASKKKQDETLPVSEKAELVEDDATIVAAVSAALALVLAEERVSKGDDSSIGDEPVCGFRVVSFKRARAGGPWNINNGER